MRISRSAAYAMSALAAAALLAACNGTGGSQSALAPATQSNAAHSAGHGTMPLYQKVSLALTKLRAPQPDHHKSWVSPDAKRAPRLLFVSDALYGDVYMFTMPGLALKGTLTGYVEPQGMCADASGNVWLANTEGNGSSGGTLVEFARDGTVLNTLDDTGYYPVSCAVNKANGDLAVTNIISTSDEAGNVEVFHNATGTPTTYTSSNMFEYFFAGYDPSGNLFVDGSPNISRTSTSFAELVSGGTSMTPITVGGGTVAFPGMVQWYSAGSYWAVGDQLCSPACVDWVTISGSTGTITGKTTFSSPTGDMVQGTIGANGEKYLAGGMINFTTGSTVNRWPWDAGGSATNTYTFTASADNEPLGTAISTK